MQFARMKYLATGLTIGTLLGVVIAENPFSTKKASNTFTTTPPLKYTEHCNKLAADSSIPPKNANSFQQPGSDVTDTHFEACDCDSALLACGSATSQTSDNFLTTFESLLNRHEYENAVDLLTTLSRIDENVANQLQQRLITYLKNLSETGSANFNDLANVYLDSYYDDLSVLVLVAKNHVVHGYFHEAFETQQLIEEFAYSNQQLGIAAKSRELIFQNIQQQYSAQSQLDELIDLYETAQAFNIFSEKQRFALIKLYLANGNLNSASALVSAMEKSPLREQARKLVDNFNNPSQRTSITQTTQQQLASLTLIRKANQFIVPVTVNNSAANLLLDTGASISVVTRQFFEKHNLGHQARFITSTTFNTANGQTRGDIYQVKRFEIADLPLSDVKLAVLENASSGDIDGLLGMNVLGRFRFQIDQDNNVLELYSANQ